MFREQFHPSVREKLSFPLFHTSYLIEIKLLRGILLIAEIKKKKEKKYKVQHDIYHRMNIHQCFQQKASREY